MDEVESLRAELALARDAVGRWKRSAETWAAMHRDDTSTLDAKLQRLRAEMARLQGSWDRLVMRNADNQIRRDNARDRAEKAEAKVARVEALHFRRPWNFLRDSLVFGQADHPDQCDHCRRNWPCETVAALTGDDVTYHEAGSFTSGEAPTADGG